MNASQLFRGVLAVTVLLPSTLSAFAPRSSTDQPLKIIQTFEPRVRSSLVEALPVYGTVRLVINVDRFGKLIDWLPISYTHIRYLDAAVGALKGWQYEPATQNGEPTGVRQQIVFNFEARGQVVSISGVEAVNSYFRSLRGDQDVQCVYRPVELDSRPQPITVVQPPWVPAMEKLPPGAGVLVDFYIDETGRPRMPTVSNFGDASLALAAVYALEQWRFSVPTRHGRPVSVRASQWFSFSTSDASPPPPSG